MQASIELMDITKLTAVILLLALTPSGCERSSNYEGDGVLHDGGLLSEPPRYRLDLGLVGTGSRSYHLVNLPAESFRFGLSGPMLDPARSKVVEKDVVVSLTVASESGEEVLSEVGALDSWRRDQVGGPGSWFAYKVGDMRESRAPSGGTMYERTAGPENSWGTSFQPGRKTRYILTLNISGEAAALALDENAVRLVGWGDGGWEWP